MIKGRGPRLLTAAILATFLPLAAEASACDALAAQVDRLPPGPVFLASYPGTSIRELKDAAFLYDNAVAAIALIGCDDVPRAGRIADAILFAQDHDRFWRDGRLRNAYLAGTLAGPVKLAGWWDDRQNRWVEDRYQVGSDSGNMAWAILALLALEEATHDPRYRAAALRLGQWLERWRDSRGPGGFTGGAFGHEPKPDALTWKSTEHNTDLVAAFRALARCTGDKRWLAQANAAARFVRSMWQPRCGCYAVGTGEDGITPNHLLALDAQIFPALALDTGLSPKKILATIDFFLIQSGGYAYSDVAAAHHQGLWTEGTAQAALLAALSGDSARASALAKALATMRAPDGGYYASDASALPTGFMLDTDPGKPRQYFHIPALVPLAWAALVERRVNPFTTTHAR